MKFTKETLDNIIKDIVEELEVINEESKCLSYPTKRWFNE